MFDFITSIWDAVFFYPIMNLLLLLYSALGNNLGWAIIALTFLVRLVLFPLMKSQFDSSKKLRSIQPQLEKIKKKYPNNPQKVQEEQMKLYKKVGYNPLGCFVSMILPFPVLIAIYQAIRAFSGDGDITGIYPFVQNMLHQNGDLVINTKFLLWDLSESYMPIAKESGYVALKALPYLAMAILTGISQYASVKFNQVMMGTDQSADEKKKDKEKDKKKKKEKDDDQLDMSSMMGDMSKSMSFTFPAMTTIIALSMPSAVALYWILQSWVSVGLYMLYDKFISKDSDGKKKGRKS